MKTLFNIKTKLKKSIFMIIIGLSINMNYGQVGINTTSPQGMLEVNSNNQGVVLPKVQLTDINTALPVVNPNGVNLSIGTIVYNTNTAGISPNNVVPGYYFWDGAKWVMFSAGQEKNIYTDDGEINELRTISLTNKVNFDNNTFVVDGINNRVGIGTLNPSGKLHVNSDDGKDAVFSMASNNPSEDMDLDLYRLRGTSSSPNIIQNGDGLGGIRFNGLNMNTSGVLAPFSIMAEIKAEADGTITPTSAPAALNFKTATAGSAAATTKMTIKNNGQISIGDNSPHASAILDVKSSDKGVLLPRVALTSNTDQTTITSPAVGLLVYNTGTAGLSYNGYVFWNGSEWRTLNNSNSSTGTIGNIDCSTVVLSPATYTLGTPYNGILSVPYTGGNGGYYAAQTISSTGVTGLTATLAAGNFNSGSGIIQYTISGTPSASSPSLATFAIALGGVTCNASVGNEPNATISATATIGPLFLSPSSSEATGVNTYHRFVTSPDGKFSVRVKIENGFTFGTADIQIRSNQGTPIIMWNFMTDYVTNGHFVQGNNATTFPAQGVWYGNGGGSGATMSSALYEAWADPDVYFGSPEYRRYTWTTTDSSDKTIYILTFMLGAPNSDIVANPTNCPSGTCTNTKAFLKIEQIRSNY